VYTRGSLAEYFEMQNRFSALGKSLAGLDLNENVVPMHRFPFLSIRLGDALLLIGSQAAWFLRYAEEVRALPGFPRS
jgi:hypothetical protein